MLMSDPLLYEVCIFTLGQTVPDLSRTSMLDQASHLEENNKPVHNFSISLCHYQSKVAGLYRPSNHFPGNRPEA